MKATSLLLLAPILSCSTSTSKFVQQTPFIDPRPPAEIKVEEIMYQNYPKFVECYHESDSYSLKPKKEGLIVLDFIIQSGGKVIEKYISQSDFKDPNFHSCILTSVSMISFTGINEKTKVIQPLNFKEKPE